MLLIFHLESLPEQRLRGDDVLVDGVLGLVPLAHGQRAEPGVQRVAAHVQLQERTALRLLGAILTETFQLKKGFISCLRFPEM